VHPVEFAFAELAPAPGRRKESRCMHLEPCQASAALKESRYVPSTAARASENIWYQNIDGLGATGYVLLETVFAEAVKVARVDGCGCADVDPVAPWVAIMEAATATTESLLSDPPSSSPSTTVS
jgi:hypothetical protein